MKTPDKIYLMMESVRKLIQCEPSEKRCLFSSKVRVDRTDAKYYSEEVIKPILEGVLKVGVVFELFGGCYCPFCLTHDKTQELDNMESLEHKSDCIYLKAKKTKGMTQKEIIERIIEYRHKYDISIQYWGDETNIYVAKDNVDLFSSNSPASVLGWLVRVNERKKREDEDY